MRQRRCGIADAASELKRECRTCKRGARASFQHGAVMIRFLFRFVGLLGLALGFVFLVYDGTKSIANRTLEMTTVERVWNEVSTKGPQEVLRPLTAPIASWLWDPVTVALLRSPIWIVLAVVASILMILGRKKKPLIGYARD